MIPVETRIRKTDQDYFKQHPEAKQYVRFTVPGEEFGPFVEVTRQEEGVHARRTAKLKRNDIPALFPPVEWKQKGGQWRAQLDRRTFVELTAVGDGHSVVTTVRDDETGTRSSPPVNFPCPDLEVAKFTAALMGRLLSVIQLMTCPMTPEGRIGAYKIMWNELKEATSPSVPGGTKGDTDDDKVVNLADFKGDKQ
jgi:hypothetical protein